MRSLLAGLFLSASIIGCASAQPAPAPDTLQLEGVAALVNDEPITFFDVRQRVRMLMVTLRAQPTEEILQQLSSTAIEQLIDERLQLQQAKEFDLEISDDRISNSIAQLAQQSGATKETLESEFQQNGISMRTLEDQTRADLAWNIIVRERWGRNIRVSKDRINAQMEQFVSDSQNTNYQIAEIFLFAPDEDTKAQAIAGAATLIEQLQAGAPFSAMASQISRSPTAAAGGDIGWVTLDELQGLNPALVEPVSNASRPGILEPIVADNGVYIIALRGKREPQEAVPRVELMQLVAINEDKETLERGMRNVESCSELDQQAEGNDNLVAADLGMLKISELANQPQTLVANLQDGQFSEVFEMSRGLAALMLCRRENGAEGLPTDDQVENQLYGREINMISERELRNMRNDATILR